MGPYRKLWFTLIAVLAVTFSLLGFYGGEVYRQAPPIRRPWSRPTATPVRPRRHPGRADRLAVGGRHAAGLGLGPRRLPAPDWTADWLHRELGAWLDLAAREAHGQPYAELPAPAQAALRETLKAEYRGNRVNADEVLTVSARARHRPDRRLL